MAWSVNHCSSNFGTATAEGILRRQALVYGGCFGVKKLSDEFCQDIAVRYGPVVEDLERSLRVYHIAGARSVGRLEEITLQRHHPPGLFVPRSGGVSGLFQTSSEFQAAKERQICLLAAEFKDVIVEAPLSYDVGIKWSAGWRWGRKRGL